MFRVVLYVMQKRLRYFFSIVVSLFYTLANAQQGNEWINFGQVYYRIPVGKDGIYRISKSDLEQAGFPVNLDPRRYQIFCKGAEQARFIAGQEDAVFNDGDYIEFYGKRNDGTQDNALYKEANHQPHAYTALYNDTTYYFLTFNPLTQGKRLQTFFETNDASLPKETAQETEQLTVNATSYAVGETAFNVIQRTQFDVGEGWSGPVIREGNFTDVTLTGLANAVPARGLPSAEIQLLGRGAGVHRAEIWVGPSTANVRLLQSVTFNGFQPFTITQTLQHSDISPSGSLLIHMQVVSAGVADFISLSYARITMPQNFSLSGLTERYLNLYTNANGKSYVEFENTPANTRIYDVTSTNEVRQIGTQGTVTVSAIINNTQLEKRKLFATTIINTLNPLSIKRVTFRSFSTVTPDFLIITNRQFLRPAAGSLNPVKDYAIYRASAAGGGYDTLTVTVDQLYNQFAYGEATPLAIYRFLKFLENKKRPDYLFLIGRGLDVFNNYYRNPTNPAFSVLKDYVPSAGYPASDMYYSVGLSDPNTNEPAIPTGRLSATTGEHVVFYLNKVIKQEATSKTASWRKRILHLSGGISQGEPEAFKSYMEDFASLATEPYLGGEVKAIAKQSLEADESINISEEVNAGLNLITFFGHSSTTTTDFDIGFATNPVLGYDNKDAYPTLLINGCNAGAFFTSSRILFGEDWVNAADKGAIGFIAHSSFGFVSSLKRYTDIFYTTAFNDINHVNKGIGDIQKVIAQRYLENVPPTFANITQVQQMILLGDPAVVLFPAEKPDYELTANQVSAIANDGKQITNTTSEFTLKIVGRNGGLALPANYRLSVIHKLPDNTTIDYSVNAVATLTKDTTNIIIGNPSGLVGTHQFQIKVDANDEIDELNENNNTLTYTLFIPRSGTKNLFPENFEIVKDQNLSLVFQSANLVDSLRAYVVEVDTSYLFTSSFKKQFVLKAEILARQNLTILSNDSVTYYWRTRLRFPAESETADWETTSFTYIQNSNTAWGQFEYGQFQSNTLTNLQLKPTERRVEFEESTTPVFVKTFGDNHPAPFTDVSLKIDGVEYNLSTQGQPCRDNTINLVAFNRTNAIPYAGIPFNFQDPRTCGREPQVIVSFTAAEVYANGTNDLVDYINRIAPGDSVILFTIGNAGVTSWPIEARNALQSLGISTAQLAGYSNGNPLIIFGRKNGIAGTAKVFQSGLNPASEQELIVNKQVTSRKATGVMQWPLVGKASAWQNFAMRWKQSGADDKRAEIKGVQANGNETPMLISAGQSDDLSFIDPSIYPSLSFSFIHEDNLDLTAPQLRYWLATGTSLPDGLLRLDDISTVSGADPLAISEGDSVVVEFTFENISTKAFSGPPDATLQLTNRESGDVQNFEISLGTLAVGESKSVKLKISTVRLAGWNDLLIKVNENESIPERYLDNNTLLAQNAFWVNEDVFNPTLIVTFDGRILENGDRVSASPQIQVRVLDNNLFLLKKDTLGLNLFLTKPCSGCAPERIYFSSNEVTWQPATTVSPFSILYTPQLVETGQYTLQITVADAKGNTSGMEPYLIDFVVTDEAGINFSEPYPIPARDEITFKVLIKQEIKPLPNSFTLWDTNGRLVLRTEEQQGDVFTGTNYFRFELPELPGVYAYELQCQGIIKRGRIILTP